jgi:hypothetical protein
LRKFAALGAKLNVEEHRSDDREALIRRGIEGLDISAKTRIRRFRRRDQGGEDKEDKEDEDRKTLVQ